ncbi:MAG: hypothetical protein U0Y82_12040 [Thermoleophilia bacterium]
MGKSRALLIITSLVLGVFVVGAVLVVLLKRSSDGATRVAGTVTSVEVYSERGAATVRAGAPGDATVSWHSSWILSRPRVTTGLQDGVLRVRVTCPGWSFVSCSSDVVVTVPPAALVNAKTVRGRLDVEGITGDTVALSEDGDVVLRGGPTTLRTASVTGTVDVRLSAVPRKVEIRTETHNIHLELPSAAYALTATSTRGHVRLAGVANAPDSPNHVSVSSGAGNVEVLVAH